MLVLILLALGIVQPQEYESWQKEALYGNGENSTYSKVYESKNKSTYVQKRQRKVWIREALEPKD